MRTNRRTFLLASGVAAAAAQKAVAANDKIQVGLIGCGGRMQSLIGGLEQDPGNMIVAACDVYQPRTEAVRARTNGIASIHGDYREILNRKDIDAVVIATPDHWHVRIGSEAVAAGKDVYLEKPVTHKPEEGAILTKAVRGSNRILQCGMQQRSWVHFQSAVDLVRGGNIGRVTQVRTYWFQNYQSSMLGEPTDLKLLDWKQWLGSAPEQPFTEEKVRRWRWFWDFGGGAMTDLFAHWIDVVHWAMQNDTPAIAQAMGDTYHFDQWQCPDTIEASFRYAGENGRPSFQVGYEGTMVSSIDDGGLEFRGTEGTLKLTRSGFSVHREGRKVDNPTLTEHSFIDGTVLHMANFLECVRTRNEPNAPVEAGVTAALAGHIGNMALRRGEKIAWHKQTGTVA